MPFSFAIDARLGSARAGRLITPHGIVETPVFMPVGTLANVKGVAQDVLEDLGVEILLSNTYHLYLRPGVDQVRKLGGLHRFMSWPRAILTDSGGYQVFSLSDLRKVSEEGVAFRSHLDGSSHFLSPETATAAQIALGADIIMAFDECTEYPADRQRARASMELTLRWAERSKHYFEQHKGEVPWPTADGQQALFGIVQGGMHPDSRRESAERTVDIGFPGYAIGGLSVGEPRAATEEIVAATLPHLPEHRPRYLMGVGTPADLLASVRAGVDLFDCVLPTRNGRMGHVYTSRGEIAIKHERFKEDLAPLDADCACPVCRRHSRAYLRNLFVLKDFSAPMLLSMHNVFFYLAWMRRIRAAIEQGALSALSAPPEEKLPDGA